jgi:hypothetical protein
MDPIQAMPYEIPAPKKNDPVTIHRCRAQEFSSGAALAVIIVLATGSVLQMPGSLLSQKSSLYRLAPELSMLEFIPLILLVGDAYFIRKSSLKSAVLTTLFHRHQRRYDANYKPRQLHEESATVSSTEQVEYFFKRVQNFGLSRLLSDALVILAFTKAVAVKGTVRTTILAVSYALPFFSIELLSLAALRLDPRPKSPTQFQVEKTDINNLIRTLEINRKSDWDIDPNGPGSGLYSGLACLSYIIFGVPALVHLFWPFSVPVFLLFDFQEKHTASGRWIFSYSTWLMWLFWICVGAAGLAIAVGVPLLLLWRFPRAREKCIKILQDRATVRVNVDWFTIYALLKFAIIVRFYGWQYTGVNTVKPDWLDWLG